MQEPAKLARAPALAYAVGAYLSWGLLPIYWRLLQQLPAMEILVQRIVWSALFVLVLMTYQKRWPEFVQAVRTPRDRLTFTITTIIISLIWFLYIWGVNSGRLVETSLAYFISPLVSVVLGVFILQERPSRMQLLSVGLATLGVCYLAAQHGRFPWLAVVLAVLFSSYGVLRKITPVGDVTALALETLSLAPVALLYAVWLILQGRSALPLSPWYLNAVLACAGLVTAMPLLWFARAAHALDLLTLGFVQYIAPTCELLLAIWAYKEPFTHIHAVGFGVIWLALAIFIIDALLRSREQKLPSPAEQVRGA